MGYVLKRLDILVLTLSVQVFRCSFSMAKCSFYKAANAILGKTGGKASEEGILQLLRTKCMPVLLYGLEFCIPVA